MLDSSQPTVSLHCTCCSILNHICQVKTWSKKANVHTVMMKNSLLSFNIVNVGLEQRNTAFFSVDYFDV